MKEVASNYKIKGKPSQLDTYALEAAKLVWVMKVQQPPVELLWAEPGSRFTKETFTSYTKMGDIVDQCIWPAVLLHKGGPVMALGVVQGK
ncbi:hypothetical protein DPMN_108297 [Dreissena polymorpha]|uniref:Mitochondria-eating protein C-terminal domain-containing protein n=1 Tax=Dreissena polymorpha TaxID=45954 RepID=A0A9D4K8M5_DREPO|nr:hypothetical protein DPMN_108297 [Dreissena polymorpha]